MKGRGPMTVASLPLFEPDVRISRIRLSPKSPYQEHSQADQSHTTEVSIVGFITRGSPTALASPLKVPTQSGQHVGVDLTQGFTRVAEAEIVAPTSQVTVEFYNQLGQCYVATVRSGLIPQRDPFPSQRFA